MRKNENAESAESAAFLRSAVQIVINSNKSEVIKIRFFKPELWIRTQNLRLPKDDPYIMEWTNNFALYEMEYEKAKQLLSKKFTRIHERESRFHDWNISKYSYVNSKNRVNDHFYLEIYHVDDYYILGFYGVRDFRMEIRNDETLGYPDIDEYSYDEWTVTEDKRLRYELLTPSLSTISLTCKGVTITRGNVR